MSFCYLYRERQLSLSNCTRSSPFLFSRIHQGLRLRCDATKRSCSNLAYENQASEAAGIKQQKTPWPGRFENILKAGVDPRR